MKRCFISKVSIVFLNRTSVVLLSFSCVALLYFLSAIQQCTKSLFYFGRHILQLAFNKTYSSFCKSFLIPGKTKLKYVNWYDIAWQNHEVARLLKKQKLLNIETASTRVRRNDDARRFAVRIIIFTFICIVSLFISSNVHAQDPVFTQAFLSPIYLNPAATGTGQFDLRVSGIYRRQWWTIPSAMNYVAFSVDKYIPEMSGGLGLIATRSSEGYLNKSGIYGSYAYNICGGTKSAAENGSAPKWFWTGGLQFGVAQARVDYSKLVFADQLNADGYIPGSVSSVTPSLKNGRVFPDFAAGMFFNYNLTGNNRLLAGFSAHHINSPDESITFSSDSVRSQLPVLWTGNLLFTHTNYDNTWSYSLGGIYYRQANNNSFQAGMEVTQNQIDISLGLWYRGSTNFKNINTFSVTLSINIAGGANEKDKMRVGVGHDAEVGNKAYSYTAGSSELGFVWDHSTYNSDADNPCKPKINSLICPK